MCKRFSLLFDHTVDGIITCLGINKCKIIFKFILFLLHAFCGYSASFSFLNVDNNYIFLMTIISKYLAFFNTSTLILRHAIFVFFLLSYFLSDFFKVMFENIYHMHEQCCIEIRVSSPSVWETIKVNKCHCLFCIIIIHILYIFLGFHTVDFLYIAIKQNVMFLIPKCS